MLIWQAILAEQHTRLTLTPRVVRPSFTPRAHTHRAHGDMFVARSVALLTDIINNRLYERLRERGGLVYSVDMAFDPLFYADAGFFTLALAPFPDKIDVAVDLGELPTPMRSLPFCGCRIPLSLAHTTRRAHTAAQARPHHIYPHLHRHVKPSASVFGVAMRLAWKASVFLAGCFPPP